MKSERTKSFLMLAGAAVFWFAFNWVFYAYWMNGMWWPGVPMGGR